MNMLSLYIFDINIKYKNKMRLEEIVRKYVAPIKRFDGVLPANYNASDIYNYYEDLVHFQSKVG